MQKTLLAKDHVSLYWFCCHEFKVLLKNTQFCRPKITVFSLRQHSWKNSRSLVKIMQWFGVYVCWNPFTAVPPVCRVTTLPLLLLTWKSSQRHMFCELDMLTLKCYDTHETNLSYLFAEMYNANIVFCQTCRKGKKGLPPFQFKTVSRLINILLMMTSSS